LCVVIPVAENSRRNQCHALHRDLTHLRGNRQKFGGIGEGGAVGSHPIQPPQKRGQWRYLLLQSGEALGRIGQFCLVGNHCGQATVGAQRIDKRRTVAVDLPAAEGDARPFEQNQPEQQHQNPDECQAQQPTPGPFCSIVQDIHSRSAC